MDMDDSNRSSPLLGWNVGVNPAYLVAICVTITTCLREPLLACREFATAMDILQHGLGILNSDSFGFPTKTMHGEIAAHDAAAKAPTQAESNFFLSQFLDRSRDIYDKHALPLLRSKEKSLSGSLLIRRDPKAPTVSTTRPRVASAPSGSFKLRGFLGLKTKT